VAARCSFLTPGLVWLSTGFALFTIGCTAELRIPYTVRSNPPGALVGVNGTYTAVTPTRLTLGISKTWVGLLRAPDGWEYGDETYTVTVLPPPQATAPLKSVTTVVSPRESLQGGELVFDLYRGEPAGSPALFPQKQPNSSSAQAGRIRR
jgi:hypothetical protein